jgi:hypothetical protein
MAPKKDRNIQHLQVGRFMPETSFDCTSTPEFVAVSYGAVVELRNRIVRKPTLASIDGLPVDDNPTGELQDEFDRFVQYVHRLGWQAGDGLLCGELDHRRGAD